MDVSQRETGVDSKIGVRFVLSPEFPPNRIILCRWVKYSVLVRAERALKRVNDRRFLLFYISFGGALIFITFALLMGWLPAERAAIIYIGLSLVAMVGLTIIFNSQRFIQVLPDNPIDARAREDIKRRIRHYKIIIVVLPLVLLYGLYETRGGPLLPRLTGAAVNLLFTCAFILALRAQQGKLKK